MENPFSQSTDTDVTVLTEGSLKSHSKTEIRELRKYGFNSKNKTTVIQELRFTVSLQITYRIKLLSTAVLTR